MEGYHMSIKHNQNDEKSKSGHKKNQENVTPQKTTETTQDYSGIVKEKKDPLSSGESRNTAENTKQWLINWLKKIVNLLETYTKSKTTSKAVLTFVIVALASSFMICLFDNTQIARLFFTNVTIWLFVIFLLSVAAFMGAKALGGSGSFGQTLRIGCFCSLVVFFFFVPQLWVIATTIALILFFLTVCKTHQIRTPRFLLLLAIPFLLVWILAVTLYSPYPDITIKKINLVERLFSEGDLSYLPSYLDSIAPPLSPEDQDLLLKCGKVIDEGGGSVVARDIKGLMELTQSKQGKHRAVASLVLDGILSSWLLDVFLDEQEKISPEDALLLVDLRVFLDKHTSEKLPDLSRIRLARYLTKSLIVSHSYQLLLIADKLLQSEDIDDSKKILMAIDETPEVQEKLLLVKYLQEHPEAKEEDAGKITDYFLGEADDLLSKGRLKDAQSALKDLGDSPNALRRLEFVQTLLENPLVLIDGQWIYDWSWSSPAAIISDIFRQYKIRWKGYMVLYNAGENSVTIDDVCFRIIGQWEGITGDAPQPPTFRKKDCTIKPGETWKWEWDKTDTTAGEAGLENFRLDTTVVKYLIDGKEFEIEADLQAIPLTSGLRATLTSVINSDINQDDKWKKLINLRNRHKDSLPLKFFRYFPIYDLNEKRLYSLDSYTRKQVDEFGDENIKKTNFGQDPLGCAYRMLFDTKYDLEAMKRDLGLTEIIEGNDK